MMISFREWNEVCSTTEIFLEGAIRSLGIILMASQVGSTEDSSEGSLEEFMAVLAAFQKDSKVKTALRDQKSKTSFIKKFALGLTPSPVRNLKKAKAGSHVEATNLASTNGNGKNRRVFRTPDHSLNRPTTTMSFSLHYLDLL